MNADVPAFPANEADVAEQLREVADAEPDEVPATDVEADPGDLQEQSRPVPSEEEDWREA